MVSFWSLGKTVGFTSRTHHAVFLPCVTFPQNKCVSSFISHGQYFCSLVVRFHLFSKKVIKTQLYLDYCS